MANNSTDFTKECDNVTTGSNLQIGLLIFFLLFTLLGTVCNLLLIAAISLNKKLWKPSFVYVLNVAAANFLLCAVYGSFSILTALVFPPDGTCQVMGVIMHWTMTASLTSLAAIAVNRFLLVYHLPATYSKLYTPLKTGISLVVIWSISFISPLIPLLFGRNKAGFDDKIGMCVAKMYDPETYLYELLLATLLGIPCLVVIFYCYYSIWKIFCASASAAHPNNQQGASQATYKLTRNLFIITFIITLCWFPVLVLVFSDYNNTAPTWLHRVCHCLALSHAVFNPILYMALNSKVTDVYCSAARRRPTTVHPVS